MSIRKVLFTSYMCEESDPILQQILNQWKILNPNYEIKYFSDKDIKKFFEDTEYFSTYSKMRNGVAISDLFRICYINKCGGYWFDLDTTPTKVKLPEYGNIHLYDAGFKNISYMFLGGAPNQKLFQQVIDKVIENIERNIPNKTETLIEITGPQVIQNIICNMYGVENKDGWLPGDEHLRVGLEGTENEFIYTRIPFKEIKTGLYLSLQKKYKKMHWPQYNFV